MTAAGDVGRRNRRLAWALVGLFALMCIGSVAYIDWVDAGGTSAATGKVQ